MKIQPQFSYLQNPKPKYIDQVKNAAPQINKNKIYQERIE